MRFSSAKMKVQSVFDFERLALRRLSKCFGHLACVNKGSYAGLTEFRLTVRRYNDAPAELVLGSFYFAG